MFLRIPCVVRKVLSDKGLLLHHITPDLLGKEDSYYIPVQAPIPISGDFHISSALIYFFRGQKLASFRSGFGLTLGCQYSHRQSLVYFQKHGESIDGKEGNRAWNALPKKKTSQ